MSTSLLKKSIDDLNKIGKIRTFFESFILNKFKRLQVDLENGNEPSTIDLEVLRDFLKIKNRPRLVSYEDRLKSKIIFPLPEESKVMSQGVTQPSSWVGGEMCKSTFDLSVYSNLIIENQPKTVIEFGSGTGVSAGWIKDQCKALNICTKVVSIDHRQPNFQHPEVTYLTRDLFNIAQWGSSDLQPCSPCIVIEDAHVNLLGIFQTLNSILNCGDYLIIEDLSKTKETELREAIRISALGRRVLVDQKYADFFGWNCSSAKDAIFRICK